MRRPSLLRGLLFALIAGLGAVLWLLVVGSFLGYSRAAGLYGLGMLPWYAVAVAPTFRLSVRGFLFASALVVPFLFFRPGLMLAFAVAPFIVGVVRSVVLFPRPAARAGYLEGVFAVAGLLAASLFFDSSIVGAAFAIWAFWLVQAGFALAPGEPQPNGEEAGDPFETAHTRALALLERGRGPRA